MTILYYSLQYYHVVVKSKITPTGSWSDSSLTDRTDEEWERTEFWEMVRLRGERGASPFSVPASSSSSFFSREVKSTPDCWSSENVPLATMCPWERSNEFIFGSFIHRWIANRMACSATAHLLQNQDLICGLQVLQLMSNQDPGLLPQNTTNTPARTVSSLNTHLKENINITVKNFWFSSLRLVRFVNVFWKKVSYGWIYVIKKNIVKILILWNI